MNDKDNISQQLSAYLDGELSDAEARRVEAALRDDPALARELEALRATRELVRSLPAAKAPEDFAAAVMDRAERLQLVAPTPPAKRWRFHWASLATAALVLITVGIGVVLTVSLTLTPSWSDKLARKGPLERVAIAPAEEAELKRDEPSRAKLAEGDKGLRGRELAEADRAGPPAFEESAKKPLDVVEGTADVSPGLAAGAEQPGDQLGMTNVPTYRFGREAFSSTSGLATDLREMPSASAPARGVDDIGVMPAIAGAPGPPADRPPGVVTQVGEPLYRGRERREWQATTGPVMVTREPFASTYNGMLQPVITHEEFAGLVAPTTSQAVLTGAGAAGYAQAPLDADRSAGPVPAAPPSAPRRPTGLEGELLPTGGPSGPPASQPTTRPATAPASQPTSQPASRPATQPTSAPASTPSEQ